MENLKHMEPPFLIGWKNIAHYVGMAVRTVQRYETDRSLPVRRMLGKTHGGLVVATKTDLNTWIGERQSGRSLAAAELATERPSDGVSEIKKVRAEIAILRAEVRNILQRLANMRAL